MLTPNTTAAPVARPIPFSAPMVRAVLANTKTQTRRAMNPQPTGYCASPEDAFRHGAPIFKSRFGKPGDRLWVREAWRADAEFDDAPPRDIPPGSPYFCEASRGHWGGGPHDGLPGKLRPGMFMPRWASRITLEITAVRVERLQDISEADAEAEGCNALDPCDHARRSCNDIGCTGPKNYRGGYRLLWEQINGVGSWDENPWVWVVEFRRLTEPAC